MNDLVICNSTIRIFDDLYCLNDLHKSSGGENRHRPKYWLDLDQTKELVAIVNERRKNALDNNQALRVVHGGGLAGTYVCKELVYSYAMWISPKFHLEVIDTYEYVLNNKIQIQAEIVDKQSHRIKQLE